MMRAPRRWPSADAGRVRPTPPPRPVEAGRPGAGQLDLAGAHRIQTDEQNLSGQIHWQHRAETDELLMTSPLGRGWRRIVRNATRHARDAEPSHAACVRCRNPDPRGPGLWLAVSGLVWWVQARPDPERAFQSTHDVSDALRKTQQDGWYRLCAVCRRYACASAQAGGDAHWAGTSVLVADSWEAE